MIRASDLPQAELAELHGVSQARIAQIRQGCPARPRPTPIMRFNLRVDRSGGPDACWPWTGAKSKAGYGYFRVGGRKGVVMAAHRYAKQQTQSEPLNPDLFACHECDNPPCCNPAHIFMATHSGNMQDAKSKGRLRYGTSGGRPLINVSRDAEIRASSLSAFELASKHKVSKARIYAIRASPSVFPPRPQHESS